MATQYSFLHVYSQSTAAAAVSGVVGLTILFGLQCDLWLELSDNKILRSFFFIQFCWSHLMLQLLVLRRVIQSTLSTSTNLELSVALFKTTLQVLACCHFLLAFPVVLQMVSQYLRG